MTGGTLKVDVPGVLGTTATWGGLYGSMPARPPQFNDPGELAFFGPVLAMLLAIESTQLENERLMARGENTVQKTNSAVAAMQGQDHTGSQTLDEVGKIVNMVTDAVGKGIGTASDAAGKFVSAVGDAGSKFADGAGSLLGPVLDEAGKAGHNPADAHGLPDPAHPGQPQGLDPQHGLPDSQTTTHDGQPDQSGHGQDGRDHNDGRDSAHGDNHERAR